MENARKTDQATRPKRVYRGVSPAERADSRRNKLIAAGIQVYGEQGYRNTGVKAVCAAAGLTDRYFYEAFENSEALLAACFEAVTQEVLSEIMATADEGGGDGEIRAKAMLCAYFSALRREKARARVFLVELTGISSAIDEVFDGTLQRIGDVIVDTLDSERCGPMANDPLLSRGVASGLLGIATAWVRGGYAETTDAAAAAAFVLCSVAVGSRRS